jgi:hypothetical protein
MPIGDIPDLPRQRSYGEPPRPAPARSAAAPSGAAGRGREDGERLTDLLLASRRLAQDAELRLTRAAEANLPPPRPVDNPAPTTVPSASSLLEISRRLTEDARMRLARDEERG